MGMSMLKIEIWLCQRIKIWNLYLTRNTIPFFSRPVSPLKNTISLRARTKKKLHPQQPRWNLKKKLGKGEKHRPKPPIFGFHLSLQGFFTATKKSSHTSWPASNPSRSRVGRCISEPKWSLIYLHSFSQKGGAGEFCWVEKWAMKRTFRCFTQTSRWLHPENQTASQLRKTRERQVQITWIFHIISMSWTSGEEWEGKSWI